MAERTSEQNKGASEELQTDLLDDGNCRAGHAGEPLGAAAMGFEEQAPSVSRQTAVALTINRGWNEDCYIGYEGNTR